MPQDTEASWGFLSRTPQSDSVCLQRPFPCGTGNKEGKGYTGGSRREAVSETERMLLVKGNHVLDSQPWVLSV